MLKWIDLFTEPMETLEKYHKYLIKTIPCGTTKPQCAEATEGTYSSTEGSHKPERTAAPCQGTWLLERTPPCKHTQSHTHALNKAANPKAPQHHARQGTWYLERKPSWPSEASNPKASHHIRLCKSTRLRSPSLSPERWDVFPITA